MEGSYDFWLVALSFFVAAFGSYAALEIASRIATSPTRKRAVQWNIAGALAMGTGIWAMHFVGMLSFSLPIPMAYDIAITIGSQVVAVATSGIALNLISRPGLTWRRLVCGSVVMGAGIAAMHYIGMAAILVQPALTYHTGFVLLSLAIAICSAGLAMWLTFALRRYKSPSLWRKAGSAFIMACAIIGMHYTGMAATNFAANSICTTESLSFNNALLAGTVACFSFLFIAAVLIFASFESGGRSSRFSLSLLALGSIVPLLVMTSLFVFYEYHLQRTTGMNNAMAKARALAQSVDSQIDQVKTTLVILATSVPDDPSRLPSFYQKAFQTAALTKSGAIFLINADGRMIFHTEHPYGMPLVSDNPASYQKVLMQAKSLVSDLEKDPITNLPMLKVVVPVWLGDKVAYGLGATIEPHRFSALLSSQLLPPKWLADILDGNHNFIGRSAEQELWLGEKGPFALETKSEETPEGFVETKTVDGINVTGAFSRIIAANWVVAVGIPSDTFISHSKQLVWLLVTFTAVFLSASLYLAWVLSDRITASIHALIKPAKALGKKQKVNVPQLYLRELDVVGKALEEASKVLLQAQHLADHDPLTGLANRALFAELVKQQLAICARTGTKIAVLYVDLDGFKAINDTHGHAAGDDLLCAVTARLQVLLRKADVPARLGGDEFAILLSDTSEQGAAKVAEKLVDSLNVPFPIRAMPLSVSASVGIAVSSKNGETIEQLLRKADEAMYRAKRAGKRQFAFA